MLEAFRDLSRSTFLRRLFQASRKKRAQYANTVRVPALQLAASNVCKDCKTPFEKKMNADCKPGHAEATRVRALRES